MSSDRVPENDLNGKDEEESTNTRRRWKDFI
jgi:hypothetical protein